MNNIEKEQNSKKILKLLYSQRKHYNRAETYNYLSWVFVILISILGQITSEFEISKLVVFILIVIDRVCCAKMNKCINIGAATKEYIDRTLYQMPINETINGMYIYEIEEIANRIALKNSKEYDKQIYNNGKSKYKGVKDWYENIEGLNKMEAIYKCQKENLWWDKNLCRIYINSMKVISILVSGIYLYILMDITIIKFIINTVMYSTLLLKIFEQYKSYKSYIKITSKAEVMLQSIDKNKFNDLIKLQEVINTRRQLNFLTPNILHSIKSIQYHKERENLNRI